MQGVGYTASKHALLGVAKSMAPECNMNGISLVYLAPYWTDTKIIDAARPFLAGMVLCTVDQVVDAACYCSTDPAGAFAPGSIYGLMYGASCRMLRLCAVSASADAPRNSRLNRPTATIASRLSRPASGQLAALENRLKGGVQLDKTIRDIVKLLGGKGLLLLLAVPAVSVGLLVKWLR
jgi:NAD(P)-dependent dehydrogenase (short-subunit alcohol dehydrogenase family)